MGRGGPVRLDNFIGCGSDSPTMPCGEAFLEYGTMICRVHLMSGQREVLPGLRRAALAHWANPAPNLSRQQRIVSYVTTTPRSSNNSSTSRRLRLHRKYQRTAQLM